MFMLMLHHWCQMAYLILYHMLYRLINPRCAARVTVIINPRCAARVTVIINPRCAARVTVVVLCVCLSVYDYSRTTGYEAAYERYQQLQC